jgi:hypothetical protein
MRTSTHATGGMTSVVPGEVLEADVLVTMKVFL